MERKHARNMSRETNPITDTSTMLEKPKILTVQDYQQIINFNLRSNELKITRIHEKNVKERAGFMADHSFIEIEYSAIDEMLQGVFSAFAKAPPRIESLQRLVNEMGYFKKEAFFYDKISKDFGTVLSHSKTFPASYMAKTEIIILEDTRQAGFIPIQDARQAVDKNHSQVVLSALARFHSASIIMEKTSQVNIKELYSEIMFENIFVERGMMRHWLDAGIKACQDLVPLLPTCRHDTALITKIQEKLENLKLTLINLCKFDESACNVISHGDSWISNFLFKYKDDMPIQAILIDFQAVRYSPPAFDVQLFLYHSLGYGKDRQHTMQQLQDFYYHSLTEELQRHNIDIKRVLPESEFKQTCKHAALMGSAATCLYYHLTQANTEFIERIFSDQKLYLKFMTESRSEEIKRSFETDLHFRHVMENAMESLVQILMED